MIEPNNLPHSPSREPFPNGMRSRSAMVFSPFLCLLFAVRIDGRAATPRTTRSSDW
jgi:hypothetical protein